MLAEKAHNAGVITNEEFVIFQNAGYMGLYGGLDVEGILAAVYQSVFGGDVYPSLEEKVANLLFNEIDRSEFCREENRNRMRRSDREVKDFDGIIRIMEKCDVCRIALNNNGYPYILPLNFGMKVDNNIVELYFHGANEGMKYDLIQNDNRASFEMDCEHRLVTELERGSCTMEYESVIGRGYIEILPEEEKYDALCILMKHYHQETFPFNKSVMPHTTVFKLVVENMTGKVRMKRNDK